MARVDPQRVIAVSLGFTIACNATTALACPDCATTRIARASVFDASFGANLLMVMLPLFVLGLIAGLLYRIDLKSRPNRVRTDDG